RAGHGPVRRDDIRSTPERDAVLVSAAIHVDDIHGEIRRVEAIHEPARLRGPEIAALGDAAARTCRWREHDRGTACRVEVRRRDVPQVLADRDSRGPAGPLVCLETIARPEVAPV